jgi:hypothetical protein
MSLSKQVVSRELAHKLKGLGGKQDSYFTWVGDSIWPPTAMSDYETFSTPPRDTWIGACTVAELGEMLPGECSSLKHHDFPWCVLYNNGKLITREYADSEADARARCLLCLLENGFVA